MTAPGANDLNFGDLYKEATTVLKGEFDVIFVKADPAASSNGKPMIKYQAAAEGGPSHGHIFYGQITISRENSAALRIFFSQMEAIGLGAAFMSTVPQGEAGLAMIAAEMVGKRALFVVEGREWQGVERESVKSILTPRLTGPVSIPQGSASAMNPSTIPSPTPGVPTPGPTPTPAGPPPTTPTAAPTVPTTPTTPAPQTPPATPATTSPAEAAAVHHEPTNASPTTDTPPPLPY